MKKSVLFSVGVFFLIFVFSCTKNKLGGKHTVQGKVAHHSKPIPNASVFIKLNAKEFPGEDTTLYDDKVRADASGNYSFKCYKGDYYIYGFGYDYDILAPYYVVGGTPVQVKSKKTVNVDLAVSED